MHARRLWAYYTVELSQGSIQEQDSIALNAALVVEWALRLEE